MAVHIVLLRGVNLGSRNRVAMAQLRELLAGDGFGEVRTYLQSGNVVLAGDAPAERVARRVEALIAEHLALEIPVVVRTREELAEVVARDPLGDVATEPKRYQVSFLEREPAPEVLARLHEAAVEPERLVGAGRELYAWHPHGIARSRLSTMLAGRGLGVPATARNWTTVTSLLALAGE